MGTRNKKGFTLTEIITTLVVLGILLLIAVPSYKGLTNKFRDDYYKKKSETVLQTANTYFADNKNLLPSELLQSKIVTFYELTSKKYINDITKGYNSEECKGYVVKIKDTKDYITQLCMDCGEYKTYQSNGKDYCNKAWKNNENIVYDYNEKQKVYVYVTNESNNDKIKELLGTNRTITKYEDNQYKKKLKSIVDDNIKYYPEDYQSVNLKKPSDSEYTLKYIYPTGEIKRTLEVYQHDAPNLNDATNNEITIFSGDNLELTINDIASFYKKYDENNNVLKQSYSKYIYQYSSDGKDWENLGEYTSTSPTLSHTFKIADQDNLSKVKYRIVAVYNKNSEEIKEIGKETDYYTISVKSKLTAKFHQNYDNAEPKYIEESCDSTGEGCYILSPTMTRPGYSLLGYNTTKTSTTSSWNKGTTKTINESVEYYAIWKKLATPDIRLIANDIYYDEYNFSSNKYTNKSVFVSGLVLANGNKINSVELYVNDIKYNPTIETSQYRSENNSKFNNYFSNYNLHDRYLISKSYEGNYKVDFKVKYNDTEEKIITINFVIDKTSPVCTWYGPYTTATGSTEKTYAKKDDKVYYRLKCTDNSGIESFDVSYGTSGTSTGNFGQVITGKLKEINRNYTVTIGTGNTTFAYKYKNVKDVAGNKIEDKWSDVVNVDNTPPVCKWYGPYGDFDGKIEKNYAKNGELAYYKLNCTDNKGIEDFNVSYGTSGTSTGNYGRVTTDNQDEIKLNYTVKVGTGNTTFAYIYEGVKDIAGNKIEDKWSDKLNIDNALASTSISLVANGGSYQKVNSGSTIFKNGNIYYSALVKSNSTINSVVINVNGAETNCSLEDPINSDFSNAFSDYINNGYSRYYCVEYKYTNVSKSIATLTVKDGFNQQKTSTHIINIINATCPSIEVNGNQGKDSWYTDEKIGLFITPPEGITKWDWSTNGSNCETLVNGNNYCLRNEGFKGNKYVTLSSNASYPVRMYYIREYDALNRYAECTGSYKIDSIVPKIYIYISPTNYDNYNKYLNYFSHSVDYQDDFIPVAGTNRYGYSYKDGEQTYVARWSSTGDHSFAPIAKACGGSGCGNIQYLGCATSDGVNHWYTNGSKGTWSNYRINDYYHDILDISGTKNFYVYVFRVCNNAGVCSPGNFAGYEYYSGNTITRTCDYE